MSRMPLIKLVNRYHDFTICFAKSVGIAKRAKWNVRVEHKVFSSVKFALRVK